MKIIQAFLLIAIIVSVSAGQSVENLEKHYQSTWKQYLSTKLQLDSLNTRLSRQTEIIEQEKKQNSPDRKRLGKLLAESLELSRKIKTQQIRLDSLKQKLNTLSGQLNKKYATIIDSLQKISQNSPDKETAQKIEQQILYFHEKRLLTSPYLNKLSFNPTKLNRLILSNPGDSLEKALYTDFLKHAQQEVDSQLVHIKKLRHEVETIMRLEEKTRRFLEDVEAESDPGIFSLSMTELGNVRKNASNAFVNDKTLQKPIFQESLLILMQQLNIPGENLNQMRSLLKNEKETQTLSLKDYLTLLKKIEQELARYKTIINQKLK